jgi:hypothetical protein
MARPRKVRADKHHNIMIAAASLAIAAAGIFYASYAWRWLTGTAPAPSGPAAAPRKTAAIPPDLTAARAAFRVNFLDIRAHLRLADALYRSGRLVDAFYILFEARQFFGPDAFSRAHALLILYKEKHFLGTAPYDPSPENEAKLEGLLKAAETPDTANYLAHIKADRGDLKGAIALADRVLARYPEDPGLLSARAQWTIAMGDAAGSVVYLVRLAARSPQTYDGRSALDELGKLAQGKDPAVGELAQGALDELLARYPDEPGIFSAAAMAAWGRGDVERARALVTNALERKPGHAGALQVDGALALQDKNFDRAVASFSKAWETAPDELYTATKLAQIHAKQRGDFEAALPFYIAAYRLNPEAQEDGAPLERRIREILDARREAVLRSVLPQTVRTYLKSPDASLRAEACVRVGAMQEPDVVEQLAELLDDDTEIARHNADFGLFEIAKKHRDAVLAHRVEWLSAPRPFVRARALNLFADLDPANTYPIAMRALYDPHPAVRLLAKIMVVDHYYRDQPQTPSLLSQYYAAEKDPLVLALLDRFKPKAPEVEKKAAPAKKKNGADRNPRSSKRRRLRR